MCFLILIINNKPKNVKCSSSRLEISSGLLDDMNNTNDDITLVDIKRKKYKLNDEQQENSAQDAGKFLDNNNNNVEVKKMPTSASDAESKPVNGGEIASSSSSSASTSTSALNRLNNLINLNLNFKSIELENIYVRSYLSVTRLIFIKYLFYLILFTLTWTLYLVLNDCFSSDGGKCATSKLSGRVNMGKLTNNTSKGDVKYNITYSNSDLETKSSNIPLLFYMAFMFILYLLIFVFLLFIELNEQAYRNLEKKLNKKEMDSKV
jgi:hypothetical protein